MTKLPDIIFLAAMCFGIIVLTLTLYATLTLDNNRLAIAEACQSLGGTPVKAYNNQIICVKNIAVLGQ